MKREQNRTNGQNKNKADYERPSVERIDLALAETLSSGCKLDGVCNDFLHPISEAGS